ncbi:hypothetical protein JT359_08275 [Candidatus Poribacteria bacterium]|nr:hypothetical protein [Candidatus Poribacteria bacterium]
MKYRCNIDTKSSYVFLLIFFMILTSSVKAQENASFSGTVVDEGGEPVINVKVEIQPFQIKPGGIRERKIMPHLVQHTDREGSFSIRNIPPESIKFVIGDDDTQTEILSIELENLTLYPEERPPFKIMLFSLEPDAKIENALIKVKTKIIPQIRVRVVAADGTPITDSQVITAMIRNDIDGSGSGRSRRPRNTDAEGYFTEKLRIDDEPQFYRIAIEYDGYFTVSDPFIPHKGQPMVHLLLKLNDKPIPFDENTPERVSAEFNRLLSFTPVWIQNPINGHLYKKIYCHSIEDALTQSNEEEAYLVSINDEIEEKWIKNITGRSKYLIGLSEMNEEGNWIWHSGEPVTYTNWGKEKQLKDNNNVLDYGIVDYHGMWNILGTTPHTGFPLMVILEKEKTKENKQDRK